MGQSPSGLPLDLALVPVRMNGTHMTEKHSARTSKHAAGDLQALDSRLRAKRRCHLLADDFNAYRKGLHG